MSTKVAIIGSGNIGTDLMFKIMRLSDVLELGAMVGIDPTSDGLARAARLGVPTTHEGVAGLLAMPGFDEIEVVFDATSAGSHHENNAALQPHGKLIIDMTPAAIGPYVVPAVNLDENMSADNVNMVTCGGQATIPVVAAVSQVTSVHYAEIVASISSRSAGPGTRANIDEFTETTARALETVGGAAAGKAIIILNPAEPPMIMRDTVQVVVDRLDESGRADVTASIVTMIERVARYVPGYRLKQDVQFLDEGTELDELLPLEERAGRYTRVLVFLEVEGAAMYLPAYAGNLDIMTSAALRTAEALVAARKGEKVS
jgi:acetaldehyde dehydrogenase